MFALVLWAPPDVIPGGLELVGGHMRGGRMRISLTMRGRSREWAHERAPPRARDPAIF
jgi:hypothetical protein